MLCDSGIRIDPDELRARVTRGVAYLTDAAPEWHSQLDTQRLDLCDLDHCVLGQLDIGSRVLERYTMGWLAERGFWLFSANQADYDALTTEWLRHLKRARGATID